MPLLPKELFAHSQKDDLIICWFAAVLSEKSFKQRYKSAVINKINIEELCKEIQQNSNRRNNRFNLHLLSQLMNGVTKLHSYQTTYYEKDVLEFVQKFDYEKDIATNREIFPFDLSLRKEDPQLDENLHLLPNKNLDHKLEMMMEIVAHQFANFGILKSFTIDEGLDNMLGYDINLERLQITDNQEKEGEIHDIEIAEEIHRERHSSQTSHSPLLVDVIHTKTKSKELSLTPQKRGLQIQPQVDTPTKKRRLSFEDTVTAPVIEDVTVEELSVLRQQIESELQPLGFFVKKSKKMIDKNTVLNLQLLKKRSHDVHYKCKKSEIVQNRPLISANDLLKQPSRLNHKQWAIRLSNLFKNHVTGKFKSNTDEKVKPIGLSEITDAVRADETASKLNLPTELSTFRKDATNITDGSTLITNIDPNNRYLNDQDEILMNEILLSEAAGAKEILPETYDISEARFSKESSETSQVSINSHDILAMLESFWCEKECIKFNEVVPDTYSRKDKTMIFQILLEFHAGQKIILMQKDCHDILWIRKYSDIY